MMDLTPLLQRLGAAALALAAGWAQAATTYQLTDLGVVGGGSAQGLDVNAANVAVGIALSADGLSSTAFWSPKGAAVALPALVAGGSTRAFAINDKGWVVGDSASASGFGHAVVWRKGKATDLGVPPPMWASTAMDVNAKGQIAGYASHGARYSQAFVVAHGVMNFVGPALSVAAGINASGQVVGTQYTYPYTGNLNCWVSQASGATVFLPKLGGTVCAVAAINDAGDIVGRSSLPGNLQHHAVLYRGGAINDLGGLGGSSAIASGLNNLGVIVGSASLPGGATHAAMFSLTALAVDLNTLLDPVTGAGWELTAANKVNDAGVIAGTAITAGVAHAVLLTPMP